MTDAAKAAAAEATGRALETVTAVLTRRAGEPGALLPILHDIQDALGHVPAHLVPAIADALNLSRAEVHGVITYYHHFRIAPAARHVIQICRAEACQSMGAEALLAHAQLRLACGAHGLSADGGFTVEAAYCLGLCASSPALGFDDRVHARMTPKKFDALVAQAQAKAPA